MKIKRRYVGIVLALVIAGGVSLLISPGKDKASFRTEAASIGDVGQVISATGRINPEEVVTVGTQVSGRIMELHIKANDTVQKDELLAEIDPTLPQAQLEQSKSTMENNYYVMELAERNLKRAQALFAKDYVARVEMERAQQDYRSSKNAYDISKSQYERDKANVGYTKIRSPVDGVIIESKVSKGQTMAASFEAPEMFKIAKDLTKMVIDVGLTEADIGQVKVGQAVRFNVDAYPQKEFTGTVQTVNLNPNTQQDITTYSVIVAVENKDRQLLPGMTAYVSVILSQQKDVLRVAASGLRFHPPVVHAGGLKRLFGSITADNSEEESDSPHVYILKNGQPKLVNVSLGGSDDAYVEVTGGDIKEGDLVITGTINAGEE